MILKGQVVFVTGGGRAMGKRIALRLARDGADVAVIGPEQDELDGAAEEIRQLGRRALATVADVTQEEQIVTAVARARQSLGPIDILVNNAGIIGPTALVRDTARDAWDEVLAVNLTGAFLCSKAVVGEMMERRSGKIINISSIAGKIAYPLRASYAVSKCGLISLTMTLAKELGPYNIQVNAICPGPVEGARMNAVIQQRAEQLGRSAEEVREEYVQGSPLRRMVREEDVAAMVAYFASPQGDNITGQAIDVSAGYSL